MLFLPERFEGVADERPLRMPEHEARPDVFRKAEEVELLSELAVVALGRFLLHADVLFELLLACEGGAVDALQHFVLLVAAEVASGDRQQLHGADVAAVRDVRAAAEVDKVAGLVKTDLLAFRNIGEPLELVGLSGLLQHLFGFGARELEVLERQFAADQLLHLLLDLLQVLIDQAMLHVEVVVEAVFGRGADVELRIRIKFLDRRGHHMGRAVADRIQRVVAHF